MILWKDEWNLGVEEIDNQHKTLVDLVNRILKDDIQTNKLIYDFIDYAAKHFRDEETLMFKVIYPDDKYTTHKIEHQKFTKALLEISFALQDNVDTRLAKKFRQFCVDWFELHFLGTDKMLTKFIKEDKTVDDK